MSPKPPIYVAFLPAGWMLTQFPAIYFVSFGRPSGFSAIGNTLWTVGWGIEAAIVYGLMMLLMKRILRRHGVPIPSMSARMPVYVWIGACLALMLGSIYFCWAHQNAILMDALAHHRPADFDANMRWGLIEIGVAAIEGFLMTAGVWVISKRLARKASNYAAS